MTQEYYTPTYCANHPDRETGLRCKRCNKPICDKCAVLTPVGYVCKECLNSQQKVFDNANWYDFPLAIGIAALLSYLGSLAAGVMGFFTFFIAPVVGMIIAEAVRWVVRRRRSRLLFRLVAVATLLGSLPRILLTVFSLIAISGALGDANPGFRGGFSVLTILWPLVYSFIVTSTVYYRISGIQIR
jgi:hypothetical protein